MKIDIISSDDGIHASEKDALERMRQAFNASEFSLKWQGYAGFMMMDTTYRDREIDLVLLTHDRLLLIELKKWRGKIEPMQDHWLRDGDDMGRSPVKARRQVEDPFVQNPQPPHRAGTVRVHRLPCRDVRHRGILRDPGR